MLSALGEECGISERLSMPNPAVGILERNEFPHWDGVSRFDSVRLADGSFNDIEVI